MHKKIICFFLLALFAGNQAIAQSKKEKAVGNAVEQLRKAMIDANRSVLEALSADELSYGHSSGKIQNKSEFVEGIVSGASDFVSIDLTDQSIKISRKTAIVRHTFSATTNDGGKPGSVKIYVLLVWQKQHGDWKLLARQAVKVV